MKLQIPAYAWPQIIQLVEVASLSVKKGEKKDSETTAWLSKQWIEVAPEQARNDSGE